MSSLQGILGLNLFLQGDLAALPLGCHRVTQRPVRAPTTLNSFNYRNRSLSIFSSREEKLVLPKN